MCLLSGGGFGPVVEVDYEAAGAVCLGGELLEVCAYEGCCFGCGVGEAEGDVGVHPDCDARFGVGTLGQGEGEVLAAAELGRGDDLDVVQEAIVDDGVAVAVVKVSHGPYQSDGGRAQGVTGLSHETAVPLTYEEHDRACSVTKMFGPRAEGVPQMVMLAICTVMRADLSGCADRR